MGELRKIPNVGKATEAALTAMGYTSIESLKGADPEALYLRECALRGEKIDRCQLYLYRAVVYWANTPDPDPEKSKWWHWKDDFLQEESAQELAAAQSPGGERTCLNGRK